ncbi:matrix metalloproteinase-24-like isoform X2 [Eriocheir sinensis]|uniref:Matrix metalloproteinase 14 n=1 Tax=Eriocheir sinensis TaxID=95602 RepID=A0A6G6BZS8_ERISI|nr:matrix metalloproteinase-24-like isoform X2 [Eriocheir sinensis]QID57487.1 matrix metalloproteinase 14 [Eriocheir sinensis]
MTAAMHLLAAFAAVCVGASAAPTKPNAITGTTSAMLYFTKFGYMEPELFNPQSGALLSQDKLRESIMEFQAFAGLDQTGELDNSTLEMMNTPRCGVKDKVGFGTRARRKRYALQGSRWRVKTLTYRITKYPNGLLQNDVDREIAIAFKVWEDVTDLTFERSTSGKVHIEVRFEKGEHGDGDPFDGPGGTLAHAYFPIYGGDAHFDDTEAWTINSYRGTNLFQVAAHEFGHSLGLSHSDVRSSLMAPFYRGYESSFSLDEDDIKGIQALYGKKQARPFPATQAPTLSGGGGSSGSGSSDEKLCRDSSIDVAVTMANKKTYMFKGTQYWELTDDGVASGYPRSISDDWGGLPSFLDAAFTWTNGNTYFFKGDNYWRFSDMTRDTGYPKKIAKGFAGIPDSIDAAFVWSGNGKIYFFKDSQYWRFDPSLRPPVKENYPKPISNWEGLPNNIDDALQYSNGYTYFFKDGQYWRFNDRGFRVDAADPEFPRPVGYWWFGCPASGSQMSSVHTNKAHVPLPSEGDTQDDTFDAGGLTRSG